MIKRVIYSALSLLAVSALLVSCSREELVPQDVPSVPDGYVQLSVPVSIPDMSVVLTRAVDPDGGGVQKMTVFCFDVYGLFMTTATADINPTYDDDPDISLAGTFTVSVPDATRRVHFLANQNMTAFSEDSFRGKSEADVMSVLEGSSGMMIYWARFACEEGEKANEKIDDQLKSYIGDNDGYLKLIRNQAKVSVYNAAIGEYSYAPEGSGNTSVENTFVEIDGMAICNTRAFGTVAPFNSATGTFVYDTWETEGSTFVTLPADDAMLSDVNLTSDLAQYIFESENSSDNPVNIILRGYPVDDEGVKADTPLYYRVMLIDDAGEQLLVCRNHHYILNIVGALTDGQSSFEEALTGPATNNIWVSISDEVKTVSNSHYRLTVEKTVEVLDSDDERVGAGKVIEYTYTLESLDGSALSAPDVTWLDNTIAAQQITNRFDTTTGKGTIAITLVGFGEDDEKQEGTLLIKKGVLQRKIEVVLVKKKKFIPAWVSTSVYGAETGNHLTLMFTIPETCSEEMFPMDILISVDKLDVRSSSGMQLPLIFEGSDGYGTVNDIGYKYVLTVDEPGTKRVYFENILKESGEEVMEETITLEADHFETLTRTFTFTSESLSIVFDTVESGEGMKTYSVSNYDGEFSKDDVIYYALVPQKRNAPLKFKIKTEETVLDEDDNSITSAVNVKEGDEFLLYSSNLDFVDNTDVESKEFPESKWTEGGRKYVFRPTAGNYKSEYELSFTTKYAASDEVVRIASNTSKSVTYDDPENGVYAGRNYRSITFELGNYNPFRFSAQLQTESGTSYPEKYTEADYAVDKATGNTNPETPTAVELTYVPGQSVKLEIDVTSFRSDQGDVSVDPFGEAFEIYIDAPMLAIDDNRLEDCKLLDENGNAKLYKDPTVEGRFIYMVDADRETERAYGAKDAYREDESAVTPLPNQSGERKVLPFKTEAIVSAGDIVISSNEEKVVYFAKTFNITNSSITGTIAYDEKGDGNYLSVPVDAFVTFELQSNGSRIGVMTIGADGKYSLRLRKEYKYSWYTDKITLSYKPTGTDTPYVCTINNLSELYTTYSDAGEGHPLQLTQQAD